MSTTLALALLDFNNVFIIEFDAIRSWHGVVLIYKVESLKIVLIGWHFQIQTSHKSLKYYLEQGIYSMEQQKWTNLLGYDYVIIYKKGAEKLWQMHPHDFNPSILDSLAVYVRACGGEGVQVQGHLKFDHDIPSAKRDYQLNYRCTAEQIYSICILSNFSVHDNANAKADLTLKREKILKIKWRFSIRSRWRNDAELVELMGKVQNGQETEFSISDDGALRFRTRLCVPANLENKKVILEEVHRSLYTVHSGSTKMYRDLRESLW
ncbi:uncharacterized protein LOC131162658 [Malania oleifera]|uniref:uncharacterized protein LOC131162658 n=1 Tax=Malania oleifera TaxID=397392 RepID=UPI0025ADA52C|nr:uncharacterized protein LOC131162658 [Malania oleifera]